LSFTSRDGVGARARDRRDGRGRVFDGDLAGGRRGRDDRDELVRQDPAQGRRRDPSNRTVDVDVNPAPVINTRVPAGPLLGAKSRIVSVTAKLEALVEVPPAVVTEVIRLVPTDSWINCDASLRRGGWT
jgi:hypothetical protein